jgi:hypothetical protein
MDHDSGKRLSCVVCGIETKRHSGWFLVTDNYWLDRIKILSWHPVLAREKGMRGVCGKPHLKLLLTHWLSHATLQLLASGRAPLPTSLDTLPGSYSSASFAAGRVVGELTVERDHLSPVWTGSPEAMECTLNALVRNTETRPQALQRTSLERLVGYSRDHAYGDGSGAEGRAPGQERGCLTSINSSRCRRRQVLLVSFAPPCSGPLFST